MKQHLTNSWSSFDVYLKLYIGASTGYIFRSMLRNPLHLTIFQQPHLRIRPQLASCFAPPVAAATPAAAAASPPTATATATVPTRLIQ
jgi:hypothetical protein